jgi:O-phosphoseryl-tRNA(Cys) synthetase
MTHKIHLSKFTTDFPFKEAVEAHAAALAQWNDHMRNVEKGLADPYPPPLAHPDINAAVRKDVNKKGQVNYVADYEIVDDLPKPDEAQVFRDKQHSLRIKVTSAEAEARHAVLPSGKHRVMAHRACDIHAIEEKDRTADDLAFLAQYGKTMDRLNAIDRRAAKALAEIEDLTARNIDSWSVPDFGDI